MSGGMISQAILCGCSGYALTKVSPGDMPLAFTTFAVLFGHGVFYLIRIIQQGESCGFILERTTVACELLPIAFVTNEIYLKSEIIDEPFTYIHAASALIPLFIEVIRKDTVDDKLFDAIVALNLCSCIYAGFDTDNTWMYAVAAVTIFNRFLCKDVADKFEVCPDSFFAIGLGIFSLVALEALGVSGGGSAVAS